VCETKDEILKLLGREKTTIISAHILGRPIPTQLVHADTFKVCAACT